MIPPHVIKYKQLFRFATGGSVLVCLYLLYIMANYKYSELPVEEGGILGAFSLVSIFFFIIIRYKYDITIESNRIPELSVVSAMGIYLVSSIILPTFLDAFTIALILLANTGYVFYMILRFISRRQP